MLQNSLLATKLLVPSPATRVVARPQLYARLDAGLDSKLILIAAPAGFGKTTLLASWLAHVQTTAPAFRISWLGLDQGDNVAVTFWSYVVAALQKQNPQCGTAARVALQVSQMPAIETILVSLLNDIAALPGHVLLVLDDYHVLHAPEIHHALDFLIDHLPQNFHLVIATRQDPPLSLSRLRARGQLTELRTADLQFSAQETKDFLNRVMALQIASEDADALCARTEGWAAGLRLAALSLQTETDTHAFIHAFTASHRFLTDYLLDEVLARQDPALEIFLRRTCILHHFSAGMCDAVTGAHNSQAILRLLEQSNLFLIPLDEARVWYRYHHLFAQFLELRLKQAEPALVPVLYQRAVQWCAENDLPREALTYASAAKDWERAADLIEQLAPQVFNTEGAAPVLVWLDALPQELIRRRPYLSLHYAWALMWAGKMAEGDAFTDAAETAGAALGKKREREIVLAYVAAQRAYRVFFQGDYARTIEYARAALKHLPVKDDVVRARTADFLGHGLRYAGDLDGALRAHSLAADITHKRGNVAAVNVNLMSLAQVYQERAQLHQAFAAYARALEFTRAQLGSADVPVCGFAFLGSGAIYREWNQLDAAMENINKGIALCRTWQQADMLVIGLMEQAFLLRDVEQYENARAALQNARDIIKASNSPWGIAMTDAFAAQIDLARGDVDAAVRWAQTSGLSIHDELDFARGDEYQTFARVLCARENYADALVLFEKLLAQYTAARRYGRMIGMLAWQARALAGLGKTARARAALKQALAIGEPENYVRTFVNVEPALAALLREMPASAYRNALLHAFEGKPLARVETNVSRARVADELNEREITILRRMAAGKSNQEIGSELYLSVNTIRWYAGQIYLKLNVKSRGEAVARARELGIL